MKAENIHQLVLVNALFILQQMHPSFVLAGGMAMRLAFSSHRTTEDLDLKETEPILASMTCVNRFIDLMRNWNTTLSVNQIYDNDYRRRFVFHYKQINCKSFSNLLQIDVAKSEGLSYETEKVFMVHPVMTTMQIEINCLSAKYQLAEKIRALICDPRPSHLIDIELLTKHTSVDQTLVVKLLQLRNITLNKILLKQAVLQALKVNDLASLSVAEKVEEYLLLNLL